MVWRFAVEGLESTESLLLRFHKATGTWNHDEDSVPSGGVGRPSSAKWGAPADPRVTGQVARYSFPPRLYDHRACIWAASASRPSTAA